MMFYEKPVRILVCMRHYGKSYKNQLSKRADITFSYCCHLLKKFEHEGMIKFEKEGRKIYVYLTKKGLRVTDLLMEIDYILGVEDGK